jgi:hypothetical protein
MSEKKLENEIYELKENLTNIAKEISKEAELQSDRIWEIRYDSSELIPDTELFNFIKEYSKILNQIKRKITRFREI